MENIRHRIDIRLYTQGKQIEKLIAKPNFRHRTIYAENLVAVPMANTNLTFKKPVNVEMSILYLSKTLTRDFHCLYFERQYKR